MIFRKVFVAIMVVSPFLVGCTTTETTPADSTEIHPLDRLQLGFSVMIVVRDLSMSEEFYREFFGFSTTERLESLRRLERPGATLYLVTRSLPTPDKPGVTLAPIPDRELPPVNLIFRVSDVKATYQALASRGLSFLAPPHQPAWGGWRCFAQDPDGYLIEIEQP